MLNPCNRPIQPQPSDHRRPINQSAPSSFNLLSAHTPSAPVLRIVAAPISQREPEVTGVFARPDCFFVTGRVIEENLGSPGECQSLILIKAGT